MVFIVLYPSDAKWTENAGRLNKEITDLKLKVPGMVTHLQELKCVMQSNSDKLTNQRLALECGQFAVSHERRGKELLDLRYEELPPSAPPVPPVDMVQLAARLFISLSTMGCGCAMMLFFGILLVLLLLLLLVL